ncbi:MAG: carotenoid oxygenase family protein [Acidobacteriota bacterium]
MTTSAETTSAATDHAPLLERAFEIEVAEGAWDLVADGSIPSFVRGAYYLNGPSRFRVGEVAYRHWLDGDGAVSRLAFDGSSTVRFTHRFVRSRKWTDEQDADAAVYRTFGTAFEGDQLKKRIALESPANVSAFRFGDDLLAFGEQSLPYALDPETLDTRGEHTFGGRLNAISPISAHPCLDPTSGEMFNFGISFSARQPSLTLYRWAADGELIFRRRHPLPYPCSTHDFILGPDHVIFYHSPHLLDVGAMMSGTASIQDALSWQPERGSVLRVYGRDAGDLVAEVPIGERYCLHLVNAFDDGERLVLDVVELDRPVYEEYTPLPNLFGDAPAGGPRRLIIDRRTWQIVDRSAIVYDVCPDFPAIDPRLEQQPYDDLWLLGMRHQGRPGRKFFDQVAHLCWSTPDVPDLWTAPDRCYLGGEPIFLGDPETTERGSVICQQFDAEQRTSSFLLFDAFDIAAGPIARLPVPHAMPLGFHASFVPT